MTLETLMDRNEGGTLVFVRTGLDGVTGELGPEREQRCLDVIAESLIRATEGLWALRIEHDQALKGTNAVSMEHRGAGPEMDERVEKLITRAYNDLGKALPWPELGLAPRPELRSRVVVIPSVRHAIRLFEPEGPGSSHVASFEVYPLYDREDSDIDHPIYETDRGQPTEDTRHAGVILSGGVKWDGCMNWTFGGKEGPTRIAHICSRQDLVNVADITLRAYDHARAFIQHSIDF